MMDQRSFHVIDTLYREGDYVNGDELADALGISIRTLRDIIRDIRDQIEPYGASIRYKNNYGYRIDVNNRTLFASFMKRTRAAAENMKYEYPITSDERCEYLIRAFLLAGQPLKSDDLCEELGISRTTFALDLRQVKERLKHYELTLEVQSRKGLYVSGNEKNIQSCTADYFFYTDYAKSTAFIDQDLGRFCRDHEDTISNIVYAVLHDHDYAMTDLGIHNLIIHILITMFRHQSDMEKQKMEKLHIDEKACHLELQMAEELIKRIRETTGIRITEDELGYIAVHMIGARLFTMEDENLISLSTLNLVKDLFDEIDHHFGICFFEDVELFSLMCMHMEPMIQRVRNRIPMRNPLLKEIKSENPNGYDLAVYACQWLSQRLDVQIDENEMGYLALHFGVALERKKSAERKRILAVCASGAGTSRMLKYSLEKIFKNGSEEITTARVSDLKQMDLHDFDLIVTTVPFSHPDDVRVIQVSCFISESDQIQLKNALYSEKHDAKVFDAFEPGLFFDLEECDSAQNALQVMVHALHKSISVPEDFLKLTLKREQLSSTYMTNRCAVPHPSSVLLEENRIVIMHIRKPVIWFGGEKVEWIFLLGMKKQEDSISEQLIHALFALIHDTGAMKELRSSCDYRTFLSAFERISGSTQMEDENIFQ